MITPTRKLVLCIAVAALGLAGCAEKKLTIEDLKKMPPPQRPAELSKLDFLVGNWNYSGDIKMAGLDQLLHGTGKGTIAWDCGNRILVEHMTWEIPELGEAGKMNGLALYTYDPHERDFVNVWASDAGDMVHGEMDYHEKTGTWHLKGWGRSPMTGEKVRVTGTMKQIDANTFEWTHEEHDALGLKRHLEMKGTSKKQ